MLEVNLLYPQGVEPETQALPFAQTLIRDLNLDRVLDRITRAGYIRDTVEKYICIPCHSAETIYYRQQIFKDFQNLLEFVEEAYRISGKTQGIEGSRRVLWNQTRLNVEDKLRTATEVCLNFFEIFEELAALLKKHESTFQSEGLKALADHVCSYVYGEDYAELKTMIKSLPDALFANKSIKLLIETGPGLKAAQAILDNLLTAPVVPEGFFSKLFGGGKSSNNFIYMKSYPIALDGDLDDVRKNVILHLTSVITAITTGLSRFFGDFRTEVAFYMGTTKIIEKAIETGFPVSFPEVLDQNARIIEAEELYDLSIALFLGKPKDKITEDDVITNGLSMQDGRILVVTGPNQGGKTSYLRAVGIAQLLMQSGMPVPAKSYRASLSDVIYTHFPEEEDKDMKHGKLAEELTRLREAFNYLTGDSLVLMNDSFATTTTREGSIIAEDVIKALAMIGARIVFVTHLFEFASSSEAYNQTLPNGEKVVNLIAACKEQPDGSMKRTYKIIPGAPEKQVYAKEFAKIFSGD